MNLQTNLLDGGLNFCGDGIVFHLTPTDYIITNATAPTVVFSITTTIPPIGSKLVLFGQNLFVGTGNGGDRFIYAANPQTTYNNIVAALNRNFLLRGKFNASFASPNATITLTTLGLQTMNFEGIFGSIAITSSSQGTDPQTESYNIAYQLYDSNDMPITDDYTTKPLLSMTGEVLPVIADFKSDVFGGIDINYNHLNSIVRSYNTFYKSIKLLYGTNVDAEFSTNYFVMRGKLLKGEARNQYDYNFLEVGQFAKFLNSRPNGVLFRGELQTLWFWGSSVTNASTLSEHRVAVRQIRDNNVEIDLSYRDFNTATVGKMLAIPIGTTQFAYNSETQYVEYWIERNLERVSEIRRFELCDWSYLNRAELVFENRFGAWDSIVFEMLMERTINVAQTTVEATQIVNLNLDTINYQFNTDDLQKITLLATFPNESEDVENYYQEFLKSHTRQIKVVEFGITKYYNFIADNATYATFTQSGKTQIEVSGFIDNQKRW